MIETVYKTRDGEVFESYEKAKAHEESITLLSYIKENISSSYCDDSGRNIIEEEDVAAFIRKHWASLCMLIEF